MDGLDECEQNEIQRVLKTFREMESMPDHKILISGRETLNLKTAFSDVVELPISNEDIIQDIRRFIDWRIDEKMKQRRLTETTEVVEEIRECLNDKADRM